MKKFLLLLGLIGLMFFASAPRVAASEKDVGQFVLPACFDYAQQATDIQAVNLSFECVTVIATRDPGSLSVEIRKSSGLREESPAFKSSLSKCDVNINDFCFSHRQCTRLRLFNTRYNVTPTVISTSNGGAGY